MTACSAARTTTPPTGTKPPGCSPSTPRWPPWRARTGAFLTRAITWAAQQGISQFLDLGAGLPAGQNTHQIAQAVNPAATTAYADTDPVVLSHARALLATSGRVAVIAADLRDPPGVLADPGLRAVIDPAGRPASSSAPSCTSWTPTPPGR